MVTQLEDLPIRDSLRGKKPYGAPHDPVPVALNVNENTHPIPEQVRESILQNIAAVTANLNRYPQRDFPNLRQALADYLGHQLKPENIWAANGSNEILQQILQAFGGTDRSVLTFTPTYSMYPLLADGTDTGFIAEPREHDFTLKPETVAAALKKHAPDVTILCGPNNPTGTKLNLETILAAYENTHGMLVIDEAYKEFDDSCASALTLLPGRPRLIVSRTMSKAFAFAGVRLGYLAAHPAVSEALKLVRLPYHLSTLTQAAASAALKHAKLMLQTVADIREQKRLLQNGVETLGLKCYPSGANFLLVAGFKNPNQTFQQLLKQGILVRDTGIPGTLRITAGTADETGAVLKALTQILPG